MSSAPKVQCFVKPSNVVSDPFGVIGSHDKNARDVWRWGGGNTLPCALSFLARSSVAHRRVLNDKADYVTGRGFICDEDNEPLTAFVNRANGQGETLRQVVSKLCFDKTTFGNAFVEVVTDARRSFLSLFHQDATRCRLAKDNKHVVLHHDWTAYSSGEAKVLPVFPLFEEDEAGYLRSVIHVKDYEPMFTHYGVPTYIAGMGVSAIAYKTDKWNISRLDNSFQLSGVMEIDAGADTEEEAQDILRKAESQFAGKPGQVLFIVRNGGVDSEGGTRFSSISSNNEGDWKALHDQSISDVVVAHSWFRALSGLDYSTGFNSERILHEYQIALNTIIQPAQQELLDPLGRCIEMVLGVDCESLQFINRPPIVEKPAYLRIWEARKLDGLDYDENDPSQQMYLSTLC